MAGRVEGAYGCVQDGKTSCNRRIQFPERDIDNIWNHADEKPMMNQVLCHISNTPIDLIKYCQDKGV